METEKKSIFEILNSKWVTPIFGIITIVYGVFFKIYSDQIDENSKKLKNLQVQIETELRQKEFENNLKMTIYKEVKEAISKKDTTLQNATLIVVNEMLKDDSAFREKLKTVLFATSGSSKLITVQQKIDQFAAEQNEIPAEGFKIDVFYLDDIISESFPRAVQIVAKLKIKYPKFNIRMRLLPKEINAQSSYRIDANQIRYEASENKIANEVYELLTSGNLFPLEKPRKMQLTYKTPNYISVFIRNK